MIKEIDFFDSLDHFILDCKKGRHLLKNGLRMRNGSINNYINLRKLIGKFCQVKKNELKIVNLIKCSQTQYLEERNKWKCFYKKLTTYMYRECNHFDNYVGANMKLLRAFFNYLKVEKGIDIKDIPKLFYVVKENIPIVVLSPEQLKFLIVNKEFENNLSLRLQKVKDIFVFGSAVGLRISDLLSLTNSNLEMNYSERYINFYSKKPQHLHVLNSLPLQLKSLINMNENFLPCYLVFNSSHSISTFARLQRRLDGRI
ncbi:MAG: hypothetical protein KA444_02000 [Bacteroidia bacterium]|nr:hypothetical protein [Bacteroidia bacterium]